MFIFLMPIINHKLIGFEDLCLFTGKWKGDYESQFLD